MKRTRLSLSVLGVSALLGVFWFARELGLMMNALFAFLLISAIVVLTQSVLRLSRRQISFLAYTKPGAHLPQLVGSALRVAVWLATGLAVQLAVVPIQFEASALGQVRLLTWIGTALLVACALLPRTAGWLPSDVGFVVFLAILGHDLVRGLAAPDGTAPDGTAPDSATAVPLRSPFETPAYVFQGGGSRLFNHHAALQQQFWAIDLVLSNAAGQESSGDKTQLTSYACFGAPILAPVPGKIVQMRADRSDMPIGSADAEVITGNSLTIETPDAHYVLLAHLQANSISVALGDTVEAGQRLARCGNSGSTTQPHLHIQVQNRAEFSNRDPALRTFPIHFISAERQRGHERIAGPFAVRRNDVIVPMAK